MKKLILVLAAALALSLLCSCAKPLPEEPVQADPEPEAPAEVHVTTFTADILSSGGGTLTVRPADKDSSFGSADTVTVAASSLRWFSSLRAVRACRLETVLRMACDDCRMESARSRAA